MALYRYEAVAASGELVAGEMEAQNQDMVVQRLHALGYVPIRAETGHSRRLARFLTRPLTLRRGGKLSDLVRLTQQLATMLEAGLALDRAIEIALGVIKSRAEHECLRAVLDLVRSGSSLADAMAAQGDMFPPYYLGMIRAGEASNSLPVTLQRLAELLERTEAAREQVKSALIYPSLVVATGAGSIAILFGFVIPRFRPLFEQAGTTVPDSTQALLAVSDVVRDYGWLIVAFLFCAILAGRRYAKSPEGQRRWHGWVVRWPLIGDLTVKSELSRFGYTLGTLMHNGVSPLAALRIAQGAISNVTLRTAISSVTESFKEGKGLSQPLSQIPFVPPLVVQMTRVGEETARLDDMLIKLGQIYERDATRSVERMLALMVPGITIALGVTVALVIGSIMTAVLSVYDLAH